MDVSLLFKIAAVGIVVSLLATVLKQAGRDDQGQLLTLTGFLLVITVVATLLEKFVVLAASVFRIHY